MFLIKYEFKTYSNLCVKISGFSSEQHPFFYIHQKHDFVGKKYFQFNQSGNPAEE